MNKKTAIIQYIIFLILLTLVIRLPVVGQEDNLFLHKLNLPPGFKIGIYADSIPDARQMTLSPKGTLFIGNRKGSKVYAVQDTNIDNRADKIYIIADGLWMPNGVAFQNGSLYVSEVNRILRFDNIEAHLNDPPAPFVVYDGLPKKRSHGWKYIRFGPDNRLYVPIGAPCNICDRTHEDERYGTITRLNSDGTGHEIFARGVRNTVGFDWHPNTHELWFTDNGRDHMGDDHPPDELNHAPQKGLHFGYPFWHGRNIPDPDFGKNREAGEFSLPAMPLGPHVAALGMRFYTGQMFPKTYQNQIFIAEHGSWNRSKKIGYRISLVRLKENKAISYEPFVDGWKQGELAWGRPVDILVMPDGALLISDDLKGIIYRISYQKPN